MVQKADDEVAGILSKELILVCSWSQIVGRPQGP